jgi:hypothetical protein
VKGTSIWLLSYFLRACEQTDTSVKKHRRSSVSLKQQSRRNGDELIERNDFPFSAVRLLLSLVSRSFIACYGFVRDHFFLVQ